jgi:hypothetical protein
MHGHVAIKYTADNLLLIIFRKTLASKFTTSGIIAAFKITKIIAKCAIGGTDE